MSSEEQNNTIDFSTQFTTVTKRIDELELTVQNNHLLTQTALVEINENKERITMLEKHRNIPVVDSSDPDVVSRLVDERLDTSLKPKIDGILAAEVDKISKSFAPDIDVIVDKIGGLQEDIIKMSKVTADIENSRKAVDDVARYRAVAQKVSPNSGKTVKKDDQGNKIITSQTKEDTRPVWIKKTFALNNGIFFNDKNKGIYPLIYIKNNWPNFYDHVKASEEGIEIAARKKKSEIITGLTKLLYSKSEELSAISSGKENEAAKEIFRLFEDHYNDYKVKFADKTVKV